MVFFLGDNINGFRLPGYFLFFSTRSGFFSDTVFFIITQLMYYFCPIGAIVECLTVASKIHAQNKYLYVLCVGIPNLDICVHDLKCLYTHQRHRKNSQHKAKFA